MRRKSTTNRLSAGAAAALLWLLAPLCAAQLPGEVQVQVQAEPTGPLVEAYRPAETPSLQGAGSMSGLDVDLTVPGLPVVKVHFHQSEDPVQVGDGGRLSIIWNLPPQLPWNAEEKLDLGVEHQYWRNRGGKEEVSESATRIMLRLNF